MFESLIREADSRFHLGNNTARFVRMLVDAIFNSGSGGFSGMRSRFGDAGLGALFASWIGTTPGDNVLQPDQFSAGFGEPAVHGIAMRLGMPHVAVNLAGAWLLPKIVGLVTRGGAIPDARPADYDRWFAAPITDTANADEHRTLANTGGWWKWALGLLVLLVLTVSVARGCSQETATPEPSPVTQGAAG